ncbi:hypothetical protein OWV82_007681, partial [Melia azedarach]
PHNPKDKNKRQMGTAKEPYLLFLLPSILKCISTTRFSIAGYILPHLHSTRVPHRPSATFGKVPGDFLGQLFFHIFAHLMPHIIAFVGCCLFFMFLALGFLGFHAAFLLIGINPGIV